MSEAFGWDATLVWLGFVALTLLHGGGMLLYVILMLVMPKVGELSLGQQAVAGAQHATYTLRSQDRNRTMGYLLLGFGALMLASMLPISGPVMAIAIIGAGYYLLKHRYPNRLHTGRCSGPSPGPLSIRTPLAALCYITDLLLRTGLPHPR